MSLFEDASFEGFARFYGATFQREAQFDRASFQDAEFDRVTFQRPARFHRASFQGAARFREATFQGEARFDAVTFQGEARFEKASFQNARFDRAKFQQPVEFGPMLVADRLVLDGIVLDEPIQLEVGAREVSCLRTRFRAGGHLRLIGAALSLQEAEILAPLTVSGYQVDPLDEPEIPVIVVGYSIDPFYEALRRRLGGSRPRLVSVQRADVAGLAVADLDLSACHFAGAHHLDQLRITGADTFWRVTTGPFGGSRQVLAEEYAWRVWRVVYRSGRRGQAPANLTDAPMLEGAYEPEPELGELLRELAKSFRELAGTFAWFVMFNFGGRRWQAPASLTDAPMLERAHQPEPFELAGIYRQLRKGREDQKNEPGAADFYYGEMEMRRIALPRWNAERILLDLYWLVSGYALRASRALAALAVLVVVVAGLFALWGLPASVGLASGSATVPGQPPTARVTFTPPDAATSEPPRSALAAQLRDPARVERAVRATLSAVVFRDTGQQLTVTGQYIEMVARFLGPVLLALALLSVRNRVKR